MKDTIKTILIDSARIALHKADTVSPYVTAYVTSDLIKDVNNWLSVAAQAVLLIGGIIALFRKK